MPAPPSQGVTPYIRKKIMNPKRLITSQMVLEDGICQRVRAVDVVGGRGVSTRFSPKSLA
jgi:hypothetical protein